MLIHRFKVAGLLSFGPQGIDLPMEPLNVLIGPNGSGKSNFLEAVALLKAAPTGITDPISRTGGVPEWIWRGPDAPDSFTIEASVEYQAAGMVRHSLTLGHRNDRPEVIDEQVEPLGAYAQLLPPLSYYRPPKPEEPEADSSADRSTPHHSAAPAGPPQAIVRGSRSIGFQGHYRPEHSLVHFASPEYLILWHLKEQYGRLRLYRDWFLGSLAAYRRNQSAHDRADFLDEGGANLALVLSYFRGENKTQVVTALKKLYDGVVDITCPVAGGNVALFLEEADNRVIPATRLSDGTLRYLCLLSILLHPEPPPVVVIEEPELGLHPDLLPTVAELLVSASERVQLIVTTHSDALVDALTDTPESVIVTEKHDGQTGMRRLDKGDLAKWLKDYTLGNLWSSGQIGGNRW